MSSELGELVFRADRYNIHRVTFDGNDGNSRSRDIIRHPGAVVILPMLDDGRFVMIENYRVSIGQTLLEVPAGTMEAGEDPRATAARELIEETGYAAGKLEFLRTFYASPGICDEAMHLFLATDLVEGSPDRELDEKIVNRIVTRKQLHSFLVDGSIRDGKSLIALLDYFFRNGNGTNSHEIRP